MFPFLLLTIDLYNYKIATKFRVLCKILNSEEVDLVSFL